ncbi:MAG: copper amine oxidase N-terminal domain-containing protein [Defluviitaleaceae bacterium]|nr:copper amine oxidase N-terminal domain-containing protein [Defluviitaleaceae bacterium]
MKQRLQGMVFGIVLTLLVMAGSLTVFAAVRTETFTVTFRDIRLMVNEVLVTPTNVRGEVVEPFMIEGTVYLPIRAVAEALGMEIRWNGATSTVSITNNVPITGIWYSAESGSFAYVF